MTVTFQKRQKEMKRLEKQKAKAERRAQKKLAKRTEKGTEGEPLIMPHEAEVEAEPVPEHHE
jgi:hypothetical protein